MAPVVLDAAPAGCPEAQRLLRPDGAPAEAAAPARGRPARTPSVLRTPVVDGALTSREAAAAAVGGIADALASTGVAVFSGGLAAEAIAAVRASRCAPKTLWLARHLSAPRAVPACAYRERGAAACLARSIADSPFRRLARR
jgi:hypothetical protein